MNLQLSCLSIIRLALYFDEMNKYFHVKYFVSTFFLLTSLLQKVFDPSKSLFSFLNLSQNFLCHPQLSPPKNHYFVMQEDIERKKGSSSSLVGSFINPTGEYCKVLQDHEKRVILNNWEIVLTFWEIIKKVLTFWEILRNFSYFLRKCFMVYIGEIWDISYFLRMFSIREIEKRYSSHPSARIFPLFLRLKGHSGSRNQ